jgi:hypothetical protein
VLFGSVWTITGLDTKPAFDFFHPRRQRAQLFRQPGFIGQNRVFYMLEYIGVDAYSGVPAITGYGSVCIRYYIDLLFQIVRLIAVLVFPNLLVAGDRGEADFECLFVDVRR